MKKIVSWMKCIGDVWCKLEAVNLAHEHFDNAEGVYVIWHGGRKPETVYVGQGVIRDRLDAHRTDHQIQKYAEMDLYVTWAKVEKASRDGVETYLAGNLKPKEGTAHPNVHPIPTNSPW